MVSSQILTNNRAPVALITGGNGFVGSHLADRLYQLGYEIRLLLRKTSNCDKIKHLQYIPVTGDIRYPESLIEAVQGVDYIFHTAGLVKARSAAEFNEVNVAGAENLIRAAIDHTAGLRRFVHISSQAAAGPCRQNLPKTEAEPATPVSDYGKSKLAGEKAILKYKDKVPVSIIRPPAVFGPRDTEVLRFFQAVKSGFLLKFGGRESFASLAYVKDLVEGIVAAATREEAVGETFFINNEDSVSRWQIQFMIAEVMNIEIKPLRIPISILKPAGAIIGWLNVKFGNVPAFSLDKANELACRFWISSSEKAKEVIGYSPRHTIREALAETYRWYQDNRWL